MSIDDALDSHYGMISRGQAAAQSQEIEAGEARAMPLSGSGKTTARALLEFMAENRSAASQDYRVGIEDRVYRVFNPVAQHGRQDRTRTVVLGGEGCAVPVRLFGKASDYIDEAEVCRGDVLSVGAAAIDTTAESLKAVNGTPLVKVSSAPLPAISDFSALRGGQRNVDIAGRVVEVGQIRHVALLGDAGKTAVSDCVLSDGSNPLRVSLWGSSADAGSSMRINRSVRIEFCSARQRNGELEIYANDLSRVLALRA